MKTASILFPLKKGKKAKISKEQRIKVKVVKTPLLSLKIIRAPGFQIKRVPDFEVKKVRNAKYFAAKNLKQKFQEVYRPAVSVLVMLFMLAAWSHSYVFAINNSNPTPPSISITQVNNQSGPPFNFVCPTNPLFNPVTISGGGAGSAPPGHIDQYGVQIDWGDGTQLENAVSTFTPSFGQGNFIFAFNTDPHTYATTSNFIITALLHHSQAPGQDNQDTASAPISVCIHVPPPTQGSVTVTKAVINDNGETKQVSDFPLLVGQASVISGIVQDFLAGTYAVSESNATGYTGTFGGDCDAQGNITVLADRHYNCTLTNDDNATLPPTTSTLTIIKQVSNNNGGTALATDWTVSASGPTPILRLTGSASVTNVTINPGLYILSESGGPAGYAASDWSCIVNGGPPVIGSSVAVVAGDNITCTITNDDNAPVDADLSVTKTVDKATANAGDTLTYTLVVANSGPAAAEGVLATDTLPSALIFVSSTSTVGSYDANTGLWTVGSLANGASATTTIMATINGETQGQPINNTATVGGNRPDLNAGNNSSSAGVKVNTGKSGGPNNFSLTVSISAENGDGSGTVTSTSTPSDEGQNQINCNKGSQPESCSATYASGTEVTLTAAPDSGSSFSGSWTTGPCTGSNNLVCTVIITGTTTANAHFNLVSNSNSGGGESSGGGSGGGSFSIVSAPPVTETFTNLPSGIPSGGLSAPSAVPQVLGASTTLPRPEPVFLSGLHS